MRCLASCFFATILMITSARAEGAIENCNAYNEVKQLEARLACLQKNDKSLDEGVPVLSVKEKDQQCASRSCSHTCDERYILIFAVCLQNGTTVPPKELESNRIACSQDSRLRAVCLRY
jgi:hypothetical protein